MNIVEGKLQLVGDERIAIVSARFNHLITDRLVEGAKDCFLRHGGRDELLDLVLVPGDTFGCPGYFRMAYCIETEKVQRAMPALRRFVEQEYKH